MLLNHITRQTNPDQIVAYYQHATICQPQFIASVEALYEQIASCEDKQDWVLFCDNALLFAIGFFALLHAEKNIILPGNLTEVTKKRLSKLSDASLGDHCDSIFAIQLVDQAPKNILPTIKPKGSTVTIFTSGSTGEPKAVVKELSQIESEIHNLQSAWGKELQDCAVISTVSHQHIYGLLFRLLWPMAFGRPFYSEQILDNTLVFSTIDNSSQTIVWVASPAHLKRVDASQLEGYKVDQLTRIFSSGGPLPTVASQQCEQLLGHSPTEVYGSSETGGIAFRQQVAGNTVWQVLPGVQVRCLLGGANLQVKSAHVNSDNSWYTTDDAAEILANGSFELKGRLDRIVKLEEKRLSLVELEQAICATYWVSEAVCWVLPETQDSIRQVLSATLRLNDVGTDKLQELGRVRFINELKQALLKQFELSLLPRKWRFVEHIPCNAQGKIDYQAILQIMENTCAFQTR